MASHLLVNSSDSICLIYYYTCSTYAAGGRDRGFKDFCNTLIRQVFCKRAQHQPKTECGLCVLLCPFACIARRNEEAFMPTMEICTFLATLPSATQAQNI